MKSNLMRKKLKKVSKIKVNGKLVDWLLAIDTRDGDYCICYFLTNDHVEYSIRISIDLDKYEITKEHGNVSLLKGEQLPDEFIINLTNHKAEAKYY